MLASMNRSTQLARQPCSVLSSAPLPLPEERKSPLLEVVAVEVMHFFQQIAVSSWDSGGGVCTGQIRFNGYGVFEGGGCGAWLRTGLDAGALLLVGEELAQLGFVFVVELVEVGLVDAEVGGRHFGCVWGGCWGGWCGMVWCGFGVVLVLL